MDAAPWFTRLAPAHRTRGRRRWTYACAAGAPRDADSIARAVRALPGVLEARVNPAIRSLAVRHAGDGDALAAAILALPRPAAAPARPAGARVPGGRPSPAWLAIAAANLAASPLLPAGIRSHAAAATALPLMREAGADLLRHGVTSHVLEAMAVGISIARGDHLAANTTTAMLALGEYLEESIARHSDEMLKHLLKPAAGEVWVERGGREVRIAAAEVRVGDAVVVGTGAVVPVDGVVLSGDALVNEATMTGEGAPVAKARGSPVLSGTLVEDGRLRVYAERTGADTAAARIADYVQQSLSVKSAAQVRAARLADRLVPLVLGLAGATWLLTRDWRRASAILQADYSCVLKLATPVAFKSAMYGAGKAGILVKGASALERLAEADTVIFDKTGTLTTGELVVTDSIAFDAAYSADDLINLAASVEEHYVHPMAQAVVAAARSSGLRHFDHAEVQFVVAHGVASEIGGRRVVVGSRHFVEDDEGIDTRAHRAEIDRLYRAGRTLLYIGYAGALIGVIGLQDETRPQSAETVRRLRRLGVRRMLLLTGDHRDRAARLAAELGLDGFHAELLPADKAAIVRRLSDEGARIAFVGDGVNDAPALAGARVGIAMQRGADLARVTADVVLLEDDIARVADAKELADATMRLIGSNYRWAVGLNTAILGLAAAGRLSPLATSVLHNGSTIGILLNALRGSRLARRRGRVSAAPRRGPRPGRCS